MTLRLYQSVQYTNYKVGQSIQSMRDWSLGRSTGIPSSLTLQYFLGEEHSRTTRQSMLFSPFNRLGKMKCFSYIGSQTFSTSRSTRVAMGRLTHLELTALGFENLAFVPGIVSLPQTMTLERKASILSVSQSLGFLAF